MAALSQDFLQDALSQLSGWSSDDQEIRRTLDINDSQHADLTERAKVCADTLRVRPDIRRVNGLTQIRIAPHADGFTASEVALAARIEDAYRAITAT